MVRQRRATITGLLVAAALCWVVPALANSGSGMFALGDVKGLAFDVPGLLGNIGFQYWALEEEHDSPGPDVSETPITANEHGVAAFYEWVFGPAALGVGALSYGYKETGAKTHDAEGIPTLIRTTIVSEGEVVPAGSVRASIPAGPVSIDGQAIVWSGGVAWSVRAGWDFGQVRFGVGYIQAGPNGLKGPTVFIGSSF